jgi:hypothetical protein
LPRVPNSPPQLLVAQVAFGADIFLNGERVADVGRGPSGWWGRREPVWIPLPRPTLRAGAKTLHLRLRVRPEFAGYLTRESAAFEAVDDGALQSRGVPKPAASSRTRSAEPGASSRRSATTAGRSQRSRGIAKS